MIIKDSKGTETKTTLAVQVFKSMKGKIKMIIVVLADNSNEF